MSVENAPKKSGLPVWLPWVMALGGLGLAAWGSLNNNMAGFVAGVVVLFGSTLVSRALVSQRKGVLEAWAEAAIGGQGPVPPKNVQQELIERARQSDAETQEEIKAAYEEECRRWSAEHDPT